MKERGRSSRDEHKMRVEHGSPPLLLVGCPISQAADLFWVHLCDGSLRTNCEDNELGLVIKTFYGLGVLQGGRALF